MDTAPNNRYYSPRFGQQHINDASSATCANMVGGRIEKGLSAELGKLEPHMVDDSTAVREKHWRS